MPALLLITVALPALACGPSLGPPLAKLWAGAVEGPLVHASSTVIPVEWKLLEPGVQPSPAPYLFVHLADSSGNVLRVFDRQMPTASAPLEYLEIWQSALAEPLSPGRYRLMTGLYDAASGRHWQLETNGDPIDEGKYEIMQIEVQTGERKTPELGFEGEWLPAEKGQKHNPGRRWLGKGGAIRLRETTGWRELVLSVSITELPAAEHRLAMEDAGEPQLTIRNGCDTSEGQSGREAGDGDEGEPGEAVLVSGYGLQSLSLRLDARDDCSIVFEPNFEMLDLEDFTIRSVGLESAFFRPSPDPGR